MKKIFGIIAVLCAMLVLAGCATTSGPDPVQAGAQNAISGKPSNVLVGSAIDANQTASEQKARGQIVMAIANIARNMADDYAAASGANATDASNFRREFTAASGTIPLSGLTRAFREQDRKKVWYTVIYYNKDNVLRDLKQAESKAKAAVPSMAGFSSDTYFEKRFQEAASK